MSLCTARHAEMYGPDMGWHGKKHMGTRSHTKNGTRWQQCQGAVPKNPRGWPRSHAGGVATSNHETSRKGVKSTSPKASPTSVSSGVGGPFG